MDVHLDQHIEQQIAQCLDLLQGVFGPDLLGVYLYGSALVGGLQKYSDIDLFAVIARPAARDEKARLASALQEISGVYLKSAKRPVELTLVVQSEVNPWRYPPTFAFQYGEWLREKFTSGEIEPWDSWEMPDLAILITQVLLASRTIYGPRPDRLLDQVPYPDFVTASTHEIDNLLSGLDEDTRNGLLTLARVWSTLETDSIRSKPAAAAWAIERLPAEHRPVLQRARAISLGEIDRDRWDDLQDKIGPCADHIVAKIMEKAASVDPSTAAGKTIHLAE